MSISRCFTSIKIFRVAMNDNSVLKKKNEKDKIHHLLLECCSL